jgi:hypothetical protein
MITVKEAVKIACEFLIEVLEDEQVKEIRLEEVELAEDGRFWEVTLSFVARATPLAEELGIFCGREYKVVTVWAEDGNVRSMKIRQLA